MAAIFQTSIPPQNFETIRNSIVAILGDEFASQFAKDSSYPNVTKVWAERFVPINSDTETPTINVNLARGDWSNINVRSSEGTYVFNIDIYTSAPATAEDGPGDQAAMLLMNKIAGMVRAILSHPGYKRLGMPSGVVGSLPVVERFIIGDKNTVKDALSDVVGRIQVTVKAIETQEDSNYTAVAINETKTQVFLEESEMGFYYKTTPNA